MRKSVIDPVTIHPEQRSEQEWLELEQMARVEVTSEDLNFPIESALASGKGPGWRAAEKGKQIIRIIFDKPRPLRRIRLEFLETENPGIHSSMVGPVRRGVQRYCSPAMEL